MIECAKRTMKELEKTTLDFPSYAFNPSFEKGEGEILTVMAGTVNVWVDASSPRER